MRETIHYRGYEIVPHNDGYVVKLKGEVMTSQPSQDFAVKWIDREIERMSNPS
jgi:hypothetical protein